MTDLQLAAIISQAMFVGEAYGKKVLNADLGEDERFRNYARGMLDTLMRELSLENKDRVLEKALQDFFAMNGY